MSANRKKRPLGAAALVTKEKSPSTCPVRDCEGLSAFAATLQCAFRPKDTSSSTMSSRCIPCAYKIANFDVALDGAFCKEIPNQRPEMCPRANLQPQDIEQGSRTLGHSVLGYTIGMSVLTVGDGDFSFSLALARMGCRVTATSYESKVTLLDVYRTVNIEENLTELQSRGCAVAFNVDATQLHKTLHPNHAAAVPAVDKFQRIVWNFPCSAVAKGQDGQNQEMDHNIELLQKFVTNVRDVCRSDGQIHMNHKTKPPFNQWKINEVVVSAAAAAGTGNICYLGRVVLDRHMFPPYTPRKALDRKSFPCHDACTYVFQMTDPNTSIQERDLCLESTVLSDWAMLTSLEPSSLVSVTPDLILELRTNLLESAKHRSASGGETKKKRKRY